MSMSMSESYGRHRMDRTLDEIAAEMNSGLTESSSSIPFGRDYEERDYIGAPIKGTSSSSRRPAPYSTSRRGRDRDSYRHGGRDDSLEREESRNNRVFVANLSYGTTWQMLKDHMRKAGPVRCDIFVDSGGSSRGMGLAVYDDAESAETALRTLTNTELDGRKIYLRKDMQHKEREKAGISSYRGRGKPLPNPSATVFVGNLDYSVTWQKLKDIFKVAGRVLNADILMDHHGKSKGYGEVQFDDPSDAISAIALFHGQMLCDRPMTVRMDSRSPFQPDPLQLKLSGGRNSDMSRTGSGQRSDREYGYEQKSLSTNYTSLRDPDPYPRRTDGYIGEPSRRTDFHDNRRISSPPPSYLRESESLNLRGSESSRSYYSSLGAESDGYRSRFSGRSSIGERRGGDYRERESDRRSSEGNRKLFVKNLNYGTSWQHLKDLFRGAGSVHHVDILEGPDGRSKGCAVVLFDLADAARKAIDMFNDYELDGRRLEVRYDRMN